MRRWMKSLSVCGIIGATLTAAIAAERFADRRADGTKKSRHPGAQYFTGGSSSDGVASANQELDRLVSEVNEQPKRFVRSRIQETNAADSPTHTVSDSATNLETDATADTRTGSKPIRRATVESVRERPSKSNSLEIQAISAARRNELDDIETGTIDAAYRQPKGAKSQIQLARGESRDAVREPVADELEDFAIQQPAKPQPARGAVGSRNRIVPVRTTISRPSVSGQIGTPTVTVEWVKRGEINVGQECACDLLVKNTGKISARQVIVEAFFPSSVRLTNADPQPTEVEDHLEWLIDELPAGAEQTISILMIPSQRGELETRAQVRFTGTAANVFNVAEPLLKLALSGPDEVAIGDPMMQTVTISNPGSGVANNVQVQLTIPSGLELTREDRRQMDLGSLAPGESRTVRLSFVAVAGGEQTIEVEATAGAELQQYAEATIVVTAPILHAEITGPAQRQAGREAKYTIHVTNDGQATTHNVRVMHQLPDGFRFVKAEKNGRFDPASGTITWFVGALEPRDEALLQFTAVANELGEFDHHAQVTTDNIVAVNSAFTTTIEGAAELAVEIIDLNDSEASGDETAYEVRVSNTGTKSARRVGLTLELPRGLQVGRVEAPTEHFIKSGLILFNDLPDLAPGKTALYRVHVSANTDGNLRIRARATSESIDDEVIAKETTKFQSE